MDYESMMASGDTDKVSAENDVSLRVAELVAKIIAKGSLPGQTADVQDPDAVIDGILMGLALILEQAPEASTPRALRQQCEEFGKRLLYHGKVFRTSFEHSGVHPIAHVIEGFGKSRVN